MEQKITAMIISSKPLLDAVASVAPTHVSSLVGQKAGVTFRFSNQLPLVQILTPAATEHFWAGVVLLSMSVSEIVCVGKSTFLNFSSQSKRIKSV